MSAKPNSFKIGLFVLFGVGFLIAALLAFGARSYFQVQRIFETYVTGEVSGLSVGAPVKLRGVSIGKVTFIGFIWNEYPEYGTEYVLIRFKVARDNPMLPRASSYQPVIDREVAKGLRARVESQGITGSSILALDYLDPTNNPPMDVPWTPKHYYIPSAPGQFNEIMKSIEKTLSRLEKLNLSNTLERLDNVLESTEHLVKHVDEVDFVALGTNANALVAGLKDSNVRLQETLGSAQDALNRTDLPGMGRRTQELETHLIDLATDLQKVVAGLDTGSLNATLANTREATARLNDLMQELKQRPSSIIFSKTPPRVQAVEPPKKQ